MRSSGSATSPISDAGRAYLSLLEAARPRWESAVAVHPWRLDVLDLRPREPADLAVQVEYRVRAGQPIMIFTLGHGDGMTPFPVASGDICSLAAAPAVLDAFLLQVAEPAEPNLYRRADRARFCGVRPCTISPMSDGRAWPLFERLWDADQTALSDDQRALVAMAGVRQEINSGGFDRYFRYSFGDTAETARDTARAVGCELLAVLIERGIDRNGLAPYSRDAGVREARIDDGEIEFDDLDDSFYALETEVDLDGLMESIAERIAG